MRSQDECVGPTTVANPDEKSTKKSDITIRSHCLCWTRTYYQLRSEEQNDGKLYKSLATLISIGNLPDKMSTTMITTVIIFIRTRNSMMWSGSEKKRAVWNI